jgi:hypothetical protein
MKCSVSLAFATSVLLALYAFPSAEALPQNLEVKVGIFGELLAF